ncbi:MAG: protein kinase [Microthrixaceae bacterium]
MDGSYELISELGSSSATKVFLAADQGLKRKVVLRILREELVADEPALHAFSERMKRESKLSHDNILLVLKSGAVTPSTGRGPDVPYYVTDFLPMGNLRSMLDINGRLSLAQTLVVGLDVAKGLQYAHWQNTAHLDIRPETCCLASIRSCGSRTSDSPEPLRSTPTQNNRTQADPGISTGLRNWSQAVGVISAATSTHSPLSSSSASRARSPDRGQHNGD